MADALARLRTRLAEVHNLGQAKSLLEWDQQTMMPRAAGPGRADQLATLSRLAHELFASAETGRLLDELRPLEDSLDPDSDDASLIRVAREDYEKATQVPSELKSELSRAHSQAYAVWAEARAASDFERFRPALERNIELLHRYVACFEPREETYDILLDDYEPKARTGEVRATFEELKRELAPLVEDLRERDDPSLAEVVSGKFPVDAQRAVNHDVVERFGFRPETWRLDPTEHPFASGGGPDDIRITTFYDGRSLEPLFATMHEYGHGLYEHQVAPELARTPLASGVSLGVHESQSRLWENLVGRGAPFWRGYYPRLQEAFPAQLGDVALERFLRAVNRVTPSLIRIFADEVTYNLHVILRFELEQEIVEGRVDVRSLPEEWNRRMDEYLGVEVPSDAEGVLQDVHWANGSFGYFPTYSLGNVMSAQIWERLRAELPELDEQLERGEFEPLKEWLRDRVHRHGRKFSPEDTLKRAVGSGLEPAPYLRYLREKFAAGVAA